MFRFLTLNVFNKRRIEKTFNVMGLIKGEIEPGDLENLKNM
jgi:hypothetical protein